MMKRNRKTVNMVHLETLDWGASIGGEHYYATLHYKGKEEKLHETLTTKMAIYLNKKDSCPSYSMYKKGDTTERFSSWENVIKEAKAQWKVLFPDAQLLLHGSLCWLSVAEAIDGPARIIKAINELYKEADALNFYSGIDDERMEVLDKKFYKLTSTIKKGKRK